jgi:PAS domain S-box-containing protein
MNGAYKILIVDDEPLICDSLRIILRTDGYIIDTVGSGLEAIDYLTEKTYDLVLTEIALADMSPHMILDNILNTSPETAIIILTWMASVETAVEALRKGVYDYIKKPCDYDTLRKTITKAIKYKRLEVNLKKSETRFCRLLETAWEGILIHNKGILMQANKQFFDMFGYDPYELAGKQIIPLTPTSESKMLINKNIADRKGTYDATGLRKDGSTFPMEIRADSIEYYGKIAGIAAIRDITEKKKAEQDKLKLQKELALARKTGVLGPMTKNVAHV